MIAVEKLDKSNVEDLLSLTLTQEGILYHYLTANEKDPYFEQLCIHLTGDIRPNLIKEAWARVSRSNEMLRTIFRWKGLEKPVQIVLKQYEIPITILELGLVNHAAERDSIRLSMLEQDRKKGLDISKAPFRITLCNFGGKSCELLISHHHILYDGWSGGILIKELLEQYEGLLSGYKVQISPKMKFKPFVKWSRSGDKQKQAEFWKNYLVGFDTRTTLPVLRESDETIEEGGEWNLVFPKELQTEMHRFTIRNEITIAMLLYTAWGIVLQKYTRSNDVVFGTTVSGRPPGLEGIDQAVGLFIQTVPLRVKGSPDIHISNLLQDVKKGLKEREEFERTSLVDLFQFSGFGSGESLFDTVVIIENYPLDERLKKASGGLVIDQYEAFERTHYDLTLTVLMKEALQIRWTYNKECFDLNAIQRLGRHLHEVVHEMVRAPDTALKNVRMLGLDEATVLLNEQLQFKAEYPYNLGLHEWFELQVERSPENTAIEFGNQKMSYRLLNEKSNQLAWLLINKGVVENQIVGVMVERSIEMIVGILAIVKAGGAYVPIDPNYPPERVSYLLRQAGISLLLSQSKWLDIIQSNKLADLEILPLDQILPELNTSIDNLKFPYDPERLLYVLYTSGSTGQPKGVMVHTHSFVNLLQWFTSEFQLDEADRLLLIAPTSFDLAQKNLFSPLITGGTLVIYKPGVYDYKLMSAVIEQQQITRINCAPSAFYPLIDFNLSSGFTKLSSIRTVFLGGEPIQVNKLIPWTNSLTCQAEIANTYGPTECTDIATFYRIASKDIRTGMSIPIGKPIANAEAYVLDDDGNLLPRGLVGELYIGGVGLAKGYYAADHLTEERFVFGNVGIHKQEMKLYRTGDLVRWGKDGNLEYLGRSDHQAKIRGFRVEPSEIENQLLQHPIVLEAVVLERLNDRGDAALCAYIITNQPIGAESVKNFLLDRLPGYMVPEDIVFMSSFPLSPNGKLDRKSLAEPDASRYIASSAEMDTDVANQTEIELSEIWKKVLAHDRFGLNDPFFEVGGNSISLMQLHALVERVYPDHIQITDLFTYATISKLAVFIDSKVKYRDVMLQGLEFPLLNDLDSNSKQHKGAAIGFHMTVEQREYVKAIAASHSIVPESFFISIFVFLLSEISEKSTIPMNSLLRVSVDQLQQEALRLQSYSVDLTGITNFESLYELISRFQKTGESLDCDFVQFKRDASKDFRLVPLFFTSEAASILLPIKQWFDLRIEMGASITGYDFVFTYNEEKLSHAAVRDLTNRYIQLIESILSYSK
ncbi:amino acid adenylation domain-containing protein [Paenibacillus psychroresistens]|uniref:Amino acid adenylation domain-containing protein n=1 Tax=Paenibacillus psychroresistens TaxID=1778678 RepID=A0A6B8RL72_9BACL|nr:non-ribosomal peptide synthetase [Paenibacillus psychroresistens]QGQ96118.1 amino acid adenylation domain-containing protein [Paenibacillus psychroresistens]